MESGGRLKTFVDKYPYIGPLAWILNIQYFIVTLVVARSWRTTYSFSHNTISDLGNTVCGIYSKKLGSGIYVCSPRHTLMNASFILTGVLMILGALWVYPIFRKGRASFVGFSCIALGGLGSVLVGLFPENTLGVLHITGASLNFLVGNVGLVILGFALLLPKWLKTYTVFTGLLTLLFLVFYTSKVYLGIGPGGTERLANYPQTIWLIIFGIYLICSRHLLKTHSR